MTRTVRAVLIAVPETPLAAHPVDGAVRTATGLHEFLVARFPASQIELVTPTPEAGVTRDRVLAAFRAARPEPGDLFVVLFFGHGVPATEERPVQGWALGDGEILSDVDLADQLAGLHEVDIVVISNCCYGRGFFRVGPKAARAAIGHVFGQMIGQAPLRLQNTDFVRRLAKATDVPMVCISAAIVDREHGIVFDAVAEDLVALLMVAAESGWTYRALDAEFRKREFAGRAFHVDARPEERMHHAVLGT